MAVKELVKNKTLGEGAEADKPAHEHGKEKVEGNYRLHVVDSPGRSRSSSRDKK
jgi:hypothetical protein